MIEVKLEDFEKYRYELNRYATGLLRSKGSFSNKIDEIDNIAKDIVQNCYLKFHNHYQDPFVSEFHLFNFLKLCLYRSYQEYFDLKSKSGQYRIFKTDEFNTDKLSENRFTIPHDEDYVNKFKLSLSDYQRSILEKLLDGYSQVEISKEKGISRQAVSLTVNVIKNKYISYESQN